MKRLIPAVLSFVFAWQAGAQLHEFGFWAGSNNVVSDIGNESLLLPDGYTASGFYRWNMNPWMSLRIQGGFSQWSVKDARSHSSGRRLRAWESDGSTIDAKILWEYDFLPLNPYKRPLHILMTPYVVAGGGVYFTRARSGAIPVNKLVGELPFGMGIKFSLSRRIKLNLELLAHYGFGDDLEASASRDAGPVVMTNRWSNDWYITQTVGFSYGFGVLPCYLNVF